MVLVKLYPTHRLIVDILSCSGASWVNDSPHTSIDCWYLIIFWGFMSNGFTPYIDWLLIFYYILGLHEYLIYPILPLIADMLSYSIGFTLYIDWLLIFYYILGLHEYLIYPKLRLIVDIYHIVLDSPRTSIDCWNCIIFWGFMINGFIPFID